MKLVIIGNGIAAQRCLMLLYKENLENTEVSIVCKEKFGPYSRIMLPDYIKGSKKEEFFKNDTLKAYEAKGLKIHRENPAIRIDRENKRVVLESGEEIAYDKLILALGSIPRKLPLPGGELEGILPLRTVLDADRIIESNPEHVLVVGGGLLGIEAASAVASRFGKPVCILENHDYILSRQLDKDAADFLEALLLEKGLKFLKNRTSVRYEGDDGVHADTLYLGTGDYVKADLFLEAVGVIPNTELARDAGLEVKRAIVINDRAETSDPDIYAIGDDAEYNGFCPGLVSFANETGRVAVMNALGRDERIKLPVNSAYISVAGIECYSVGNIREYESAVIKQKGDRYESYFIDIDGSLNGVIAVGSRENMARATAMIGKPFDISIASWAE